MKGFTKSSLYAATTLLGALCLLGVCLERAEAREGPDFAAVFETKELTSWHFRITPKAWKALGARPKKYVRADLVFEGGNGPERYDEVGIRFKGNFSLAMAREKKSFKVDFDRFQKKGHFHGFLKINLHNNVGNPTQMREKLAYDLFRKAGVPCPRAAHARVFLSITGVYDKEYMGLYTVVEQIDKVFLRNRFGDGKGTLYKAKSNADLVWRPPETGAYDRRYALKTNTKKKDPKGFLAFLRFLNKSSDEAFRLGIEQIFNVESFLAHLAVNTLLANLDAYPAKARNYYIYQNPKSKRFEFIPWDMNAAFAMAAQFYGETLSEMIYLDIENPHLSSRQRPLVTRILAVPGFRARYFAHLRRITETDATPEAMIAEIDAMAARIRDARRMDAKKQLPNALCEAAVEKDVTTPFPPLGKYLVPGLKSFLKARWKNVQWQLEKKR
jgi:spore coat protein CotH